MVANNRHDASGQLSGYLYQILSALLILLENKNSESQISIEKFDDVAFVEDDLPQVMVQTKHQLYRQGKLNDTSVDLWRTIKSWIDSGKDLTMQEGHVQYLIITTANAGEETAASLLKHSGQRDCEKALNILRDVASTDTAQTNKPFYDAFMELGEDAQRDLVKHIYVCDNAPTIDKIKESIMAYVRLATLPMYEERVYEKIVGWWIEKVIQCLVATEPVYISFRQLQKVMYDVGSEYKADSLPIDVNPLYEPTEEEMNQLLPGNRIFIEQLKLISVSNDRIKRCIRDYYNAYCQRSQWVRENLLYVDDLTKYENELIDEWNRLFLVMKENLEDYGTDITEVQIKRAGRNLFGQIEDLDLPIRRNVSQPFIMRGTYHELSNQLKVGWHLDFYNRLCELLKGS